MKTKTLRAVTSAFLLTLSSHCFSDWVYETTQVKKVGSGWNEDQVCVHLVNGETLSLDVSTNKGNTELSIVLSAFATSSNLKIAFSDDAEAIGGCNSGTTIRPHGIVTMEK